MLLVKSSGDSVLSDNQDKAAGVSSPLRPFPTLFPYLDDVEFQEKGSKLSVGVTLSSPF